MANYLDLPRIEAEELISVKKKAPSAEWKSVSQGRIERWSLSVGITDVNGGYIRGTAVELECLRTAKPYRECFKFGLFVAEFNAPRRAYQLDTASSPIGNPNGHDWPHEHIGQDRRLFGKDNFPNTFDLALDCFQKTVNMEFEEKPCSPFEFNLRP